MSNESNCWRGSGGASLIEVGSLLEDDEGDWGCEHRGSDKQRDQNGADVWLGCEHRERPDWPKQQNGSYQAGRETSPFQDDRQDVHERAVDQHESREAEGERRIFGRNFDGDDSDDNDEAVCEVEILPARGKVKDLACPIAPVENKLFDDVESVARDAKPEHDLKMTHEIRLMAFP